MNSPWYRSVGRGAGPGATWTPPGSAPYWPGIEAPRPRAPPGPHGPYAPSPATPSGIPVSPGPRGARVPREPAGPGGGWHWVPGAYRGYGVLGAGGQWDHGTYGSRGNTPPPGPPRGHSCWQPTLGAQGTGRALGGGPGGGSWPPAGMHAIQYPPWPAPGGTGPPQLESNRPRGPSPGSRPGGRGLAGGPGPHCPGRSPPWAGPQPPGRTGIRTGAAMVLWPWGAARRATLGRAGPPGAPPCPGPGGQMPVPLAPKGG